MPSHFTAFDLHPQILENLSVLGYETPTPIQQKSIPSALLGQDVMGLAQTGTGKTAAFLLPILHRLIPGPRGQVRALILAPTRELAQQIHTAFGEMAKSLKLRSVALYGGMSIHPQKEKLRRGAEVVIACPGRLLDHLRQRSINLSSVEVFVLDEADHMFDVGFLPDVRQIMQQLPTQRQSLLFSATMPKEVRQLANEILKAPVHVQISHTTTAKTITQAIYPVPQTLKTDLLLHLLETLHIHTALVFTRTKHRAQRLAEQLNKAGYSATSLQGNLSQNKRQRALDSFRSGKLQLLVATDIASRGIDVASISHVFNYDMPDTVEAYTHRIGRTGRAAKLGDAFTLLAPEERVKLRTLERTLNVKIEQRMLPEFDYKAASQSGTMQQQNAPSRAGRERPAASKRTFTSHAGASTGSYRGKAKRAASSVRGYADKPARQESTSYTFGNRMQEDRGDRPARRNKTFASFEGGRSSSYADRREGARTARPQHSFKGAEHAPFGGQAARAPRGDGARTGRPQRIFKGAEHAPFGGQAARTPRGDASEGRRRPSSSYADRGDKPAGRARSFTTERGDAPEGRRRSSSSYAARGDKPAGRTRSFGTDSRGDAPLRRAKPGRAFADAPAGSRTRKPATKTPVKPGAAKKPFVHRKKPR